VDALGFTGPDGALYIADWYSMQSNHYRNHEGQTNPDLGRVYRLRDQSQQGYPIFDLRAVSSRELVEEYLAHPNPSPPQLLLKQFLFVKNFQLFLQTSVLLLSPLSLPNQVAPHSR
jgi:hypothetical protein